MFGLFKKKQPSMFDEMASILARTATNGPKADVPSAVNMAYGDLLSGVIDKNVLTADAQRLAGTKIPFSTQDLALSISLKFFKSAELRESLRGTQLKARAQMFKWLTEGKVNPLIAETFENSLYKDFHPNNR